MASNGRPGNQNQLQRSGYVGVNDIRGQTAIPLSSSYLNPQMPSSNAFNCSLPVRPNPIIGINRMGMGGYGYGGYNPYSRYPTNMFTPGYGGYRMSQYGGQYGGGPSETSSFIQMAEESTRPAFESIESVVEVVSSISMMLESTYHAVHSSYSAILGVVDQFSRLRDHLAQMLSILAMVRALRWLCLKVLYLLRLRKDNPSNEAAWNSAQATAGISFLPPRPDKAQGSAWPFLMFVGLVIGAPWLMFKLLSKTVVKKPLDMQMFRDERGRYLMSTAAFDFKATQRDELSFSRGEKLYVSPSSIKSGLKGWIFACNSKQETGLIPSNYLVLQKKNSPQGNRETLFQQGPSQTHGNYNLPMNLAENFDAQPNADHLRNSSEDLAVRPNTFDYSKSVNETFNTRDYSQNPAERQPGDRDYPQNPAGRGNTQLSDRGCSQNPTEKSSTLPDDHNYARKPAERGTTQSGDQDYSQNPTANGSVEQDTLDYSKNSAEEFETWPNGKAPEDVLKNQNVNNTES